MCSLAWAGGHGTDGHIPKPALPMLHGRPTEARLLVECGLWDLDPGDNGWRIHNYAQRQELALVTSLALLWLRLWFRSVLPEVFWT